MSGLVDLATTVYTCFCRSDHDLQVHNVRLYPQVTALIATLCPDSSTTCPNCEYVEAVADG